MKKLAVLSVVGVTGLLVYSVVAQLPPPPRMHRVVERGELVLVPATVRPRIASRVDVRVADGERIIRANGIPNHRVGRFPNRGNPNRISAQSHNFRVAAEPRVTEAATPMHGEFGVAVNGVPFDPGAAEFYAGAPGWQYEPLSGAIDLGLDHSHAHVQPNGKYHYHGLPTGLMESLGVDEKSHSPLVGWAADGFPIYTLYGYADPEDATSEVRKLTSSYRLREGRRPGGNAPGGTYDGTFVADYEYVAGSGDLDECNGRFTVTPDFPEGTYAYYLTEEWPVVPRAHRGTPSADFSHGPGGPPGGPGAGPPGRFPPGRPGAGPPRGGPPGGVRPRGGRPGADRPSGLRG